MNGVSCYMRVHMRVPPLICLWFFSVWGIPQLHSDWSLPVTTTIRVNVTHNNNTTRILVGSGVRRSRGSDFGVH